MEKSNMQSVRMICAGVIIAAFFMPWVSILGVSLPGYKIPEIAGAFQQWGRVFGAREDPELWLFYFVYAVPIFALLALLEAASSQYTRKNEKSLSLITGVIIFTEFLYVLSGIGETIFKILAIGAYLTLVAGAILMTTILQSSRANAGIRPDTERPLDDKKKSKSGQLTSDLRHNLTLLPSSAENREGVSITDFRQQTGQTETASLTLLGQLMELGLIEQISPDHYVRSAGGDRFLIALRQDSVTEPYPTAKSQRQLNIRWLSFLGLIAVASMIIWLTPALNPLNIFAVFIHEAGHALATALTGGRVLAMVVKPWESGYVGYKGGNPLLITAAGYIVSMLVGGFMLFFSSRERWTTMIFVGLALFFGLVTVWFIRDNFGLKVGLSTAAVFGILAWRRFHGAHYIIDVLAVMSLLYPLYDYGDLLVAGARTDAAILAEITHTSESRCAISWSAISLLVTSFCVYCRLSIGDAKSP